MRRFISIRKRPGGFVFCSSNLDDSQGTKFLNVYDRVPKEDDLLVQSVPLDAEGHHGSPDSAAIQAGVVSSTKDPAASWSHQDEWEFYSNLIDFHSSKPGTARFPVNPADARSQPTGLPQPTGSSG